MKEKGKMVIVMSAQYRIVGITPKLGSQPSTRTPLPDIYPPSTMIIQQNDVIVNSVDMYTAKSNVLFFCQK